LKTQNPNALLIGAALFTATAAALIVVPVLSSQGPEATPRTPPTVTTDQGRAPIIEAVFVLDTTGSMGGLIQAAKDKIWSIASTMAAADPAPEIRMGLVAYRDRGDDYVTRVVDLTPDLDSLHAELFQLQANGGGDTPESVNQALHEAVTALSWGQDPTAYRVVFLVGDAPPHMDYQDDVKYPETVALAKARGIRVNAIQCGGAANTRATWQEIAQLGEGAFFDVAADGAAVAIATPYDEQLARLSAELDATRLYYGSRAEQAERAKRQAKSEAVRDAAPAPVLARRAAFTASASGKAARLADKELVQAIESGRVALDAIAPEELPEPLQGLSEDEQQQTIQTLAERRTQLTQAIEAVADARAEYLREEVAKAGGAKESLDRKLYDAVRDQAGRMGLDYSDSAPAY
jgi:hypothetical protein